jgi:PAS domain S-box-containing protein
MSGLRDAAFEHARTPTGLVRDGIVGRNAALRALSRETGPLDELIAAAAAPGAIVPLAARVGEVALELHAVALPGAGAVAVEVHDVTAHRHLQETVRRLTDILDNSAALIFVKDLGGRYVLVNDHFAQRFHLPRERIIGRTDHEIFPAEAADAYAASDHTVLTSGRPLEVEEPLTDVIDGRWLSIKFPLRDEHGRPYAVGGISTDITDRTRAEAAEREARAEAERADRAKSEFLSRMSHELRTPLNAIIGFGQLLALEPLRAEGRSGVEHILKAGEHLLALINEVLEITRLEAGAQHLASGPVHACEPLADALELVRPLARARDVELATDMHGGLHRYVLADPQRLQQVLLNLLVNAVKYNRHGGAVRTYFAELPAGRLRTVVVDTGPGMDAAAAEKAFLPFERLDADGAGIEGTGLGLALSRSLAEAMGGTVGIAHTAPGEGSAFYVELALADAPPGVAIAQETPSSVPEDVWEIGPARVLYIEDSTANLELVGSILARASGDIELIPAVRGRAGVELALLHRPDVILLDLDLPDIDGTEVLATLARDPRTARIPVVVLSADATPASMDRLSDTGIAAYLTKPLRMEAFLGTLRAALTRV